MANGVIRVGLVGAGANTRLRHIPGIREQQGVEIVGVANRSRESGERIAGEYEIPKVYDNWRQLIDDDEIDAVCIGTWPYMHRTLVLEALAAEKHVLCEARMAMNAKEAHDMLDASRRKPHLVAQIVPAPATLVVDETIIEHVANGYLGEILAVRLRVADAHGRVDGGAADTFVHPEAPLHWRQNRDLSGYNILGMGIWYESLMRYVGPAAKVMAMTKVCVPRRMDEDGHLAAVSVPDHVNVICQMASGAQADLSWSTITGMQTGSEMWLFGTEGTLLLKAPPMTSLFGGRRGDSELKEIVIPENKKGGWRVEEEFINAIRGEEPVTRTPFDVGVQYMEWTEAVTRSSQTGQAISLPL
ncbi:MAG TPA: Gfo/Idh/MocA family oxidoreductase [Dehalococcoidia bacterium]|nr:Gfo/Idh/MocA family oxidoreductase [Dehalococcoidia bacterium]